MIWNIAKKEFLLNLMTFKFVVGTILCIILTAVFMPVLVNEYQERLKNYNANVATTHAELQNTRVYMNVLMNKRYRVHRPPTILSVFSRGVENQLSGSVPIETYSVPEISAGSSEVNPYLSILSTMDISLILKIIISVLALIMACDAVSSERERGTLKLMMSGMMPRYQVLLGKFIAGLITLIVPLTISFILGLLILQSSFAAELDSSDWIRIALIYAASVIFISAIYNIGLFISCLTKRSAISLIGGLLFWVVFIVIVPNSSVYFATQIAPLEPEEKLESQKNLIEREKGAEVGEIRKSIPYAGNELSGFYENMRFWVLVCDKAGMQWRQRYHAALTPLEVGYAEKFWEIERQHIETLLRQKRLSDNLSRISPLSLYGNVISNLAGTDVTGYQNFMGRAREHRRETLEYLRAKTNNFSSPSYFTQCTEADMAAYRQYLDKKTPEDDFQKWQENKIAQMKPLDLQDFPRFIYKPNFLKEFGQTIPDLMLLVFINILFFALSFLVFMKYDIR